MNNGGVTGAARAGGRVGTKLSATTPLPDAEETRRQRKRRGKTRRACGGGRAASQVAPCLPQHPWVPLRAAQSSSSHGWGVSDACGPTDCSPMNKSCHPSCWRASSPGRGVSLRERRSPRGALVAPSQGVSPRHAGLFIFLNELKSNKTSINPSIWHISGWAFYYLWLKRSEGSQTRLK